MVIEGRVKSFSVEGVPVQFIQEIMLTVLHHMECLLRKISKQRKQPGTEMLKEWHTRHGEENHTLQLFSPVKEITEVMNDLKQEIHLHDTGKEN